MPKFVITAQARYDLESIDSYSKESFGPDVAGRYMEAFDKAFAQLVDHPLSAPETRTVRPPVRLLNCGSHRIVHEFRDDTVRILRILHHARDLRKALGEL